MKRALTWLAAALALTGCRIEEAEYFEPTQGSFYVFVRANDHLSAAADDAARILLFDLYYSAPEEMREEIHDRWFYASRIFNTDDEWHVVNTDYELVIRTGGQPLSAEGAVWQYAYVGRTYSENGVPTIACRKNELLETYYDFELQNGEGRLSFTAVYYDQTPDDSTVRQRYRLQIAGSGRCPAYGNCRELGEVAYETIGALTYDSDDPQYFGEGRLKLSAQTDDGPIESEAEYLAGRQVSISDGTHTKTYWY